MKHISVILFALSLALAANAQNIACHSAQSTTAHQNTVSISGTTATTLITSADATIVAATNAIVHVCVVKLTAPVNGSPAQLQLQGSDGTILDGPDYAVGTFMVWWDGQLTTSRAAAGSLLQMKFSTAPSSAIAVTTIYYLAPI